jgi:hypothetical protein
MSEKKWENEDRTFMLRLWREQAALPQRRPVWRCSIEDTKTHNRRGFRSVEDLAIHLCTLAGRPNEMRGLPTAAPEEESGAGKAREDSRRRLAQSRRPQRNAEDVPLPQS